jgi:hypothetical protein
MRLQFSGYFLIGRWFTTSIAVCHGHLEEGALTHVRDIALAAIGAGREWHWIIYLPVGTWAYRPADNDNYGKSSQIQA